MSTGHQIQSRSDSKNSPEGCRGRDSLIRDLDQAATPVPGAGAVSDQVQAVVSGTKLDSESDLGETGQQWQGYLSDPGEFDLPPIRPTDWTGRSVGTGDRYEILRLLGKGGMGKVYLARARNLDNVEVAIKVPYESFLELSGMRERFEREFKSLIQLAHPHICRVLDTGQFRNVPFVVLQNLSGGNLRDRCLRQPAGSAARSVEQLLKWLREIARALDYMHSRGFLHRDVKPENILFDEQGNAYLGDFGIVRALDDASEADSTLTRPGECIGTLGYVAPELLKGEKDTADGRSDLYSLAAVVYLYLTDKQPFDGDTNDMIRVAQLTASPVPANEANPQVPDAASQVLERALSRDPEERPATCEHFADEIAAAYGITGSGPVPPVIIASRSEAAAIDQGSSSRKPVNTVVTAGLVTLAIALMAFMWERDPLIGRNTGHNPAQVVPNQMALANAQGYLEAGEFQAAIDEINSVPIDVLTADHLSVRGRAFYGAGDVDAATDELGRAIALSPESAILYSERSQILLAEGDPEAAIDDLTLAIAKNEAEPRFHALRAIARMQLKNYTAAITDYGNALNNAGEGTSDAEKAAWHNGRAAARVLLDSDSESIRQALADATAAIEAEPQEPRHYRNRARLHERLGNQAAQQDDLATANRLENGTT